MPSSQPDKKPKQRSIAAQIESIDLRLGSARTDFMTRGLELDSVSYRVAAAYYLNTIDEHCVLQTVVSFELCENPDGADEELATDQSDMPLHVFAEALFQIQYDLGKDAEPAGDISQFVRSSAIFHAWPYWREFVQSMTSQAAVPIVTPALVIGSGAFEEVEVTRLDAPDEA